MTDTPIDNIKNKIQEKIPSKLINRIPNKWEKIGDVAVIKLSDNLKKYQDKIGETYATVLNCKTVLNDIGGITGELREPDVEIIYGSNQTETIHKENGVRFKLDPQKVMFSSGNMDERIRMSNISFQDETVVDLFAGIGYFTLPMAVHSKPEKIFACELNHTAYNYLCENIVLNDVTDIVEPLFGDNRFVAPKNIADRVIMGYIGGTMDFLSTAIECLKDNTGIIHFHEKYSDDIVIEDIMEYIQKVADIFERDVELIRYKKIKSYAPGISHFVFDLQVR